MRYGKTKISLWRWVYYIIPIGSDESRRSKTYQLLNKIVITFVKFLQLLKRIRVCMCVCVCVCFIQKIVISEKYTLIFIWDSSFRRPWFHDLNSNRAYIVHFATLRLGHNRLLPHAFKLGLSDSLLWPRHDEEQIYNLSHTLVIFAHMILTTLGFYCFCDYVPLGFL